MRKRAAGFTLIELLIVVVIIGLLAAIAVPKMTSTKSKAYTSTMKADLRNLATAQESYWNDYATYYSGSIPGAGLTYLPSPSVTITLNAATSGGWSATASHAATSVQCSLFTGTAAAVAPATVLGVVACQ